ncbi:MAG: Nramp family divalent metal transporter [Candidatus Marinimicrobia bacterium]|nr:Nramp family divalent metal transporter [Candidatus Neomarinimicrobiota bacterium]MCF7827930.1 Nramp family divalent metal transporter [Candidatus Neomarinimicrobiota bacterium]MCF7879315.1 Nramp family divalent metal transporter [Candidatus Neomarinimicrobiota bacterium]
MPLNSEKVKGILQTLGPGIIMAGAAIGVSHLVQSTRAGADYGFYLVWAVLLALIFKYPFLEFGPRYTAATGESLLEGYMKLGKWAMGVFLIFTFGTMFTITAAVTVVTAGLTANMTGITLNPILWSAIILGICVVILATGQYPILDKLVKILMSVLAISTVIAVIAAVTHGSNAAPDFQRPVLWNVTGVSFLLALMGWMPIPIDVSVWHSLWTLERTKETKHNPSIEEATFDFKFGYGAAAFMALGFLTLGALVMYGTGESFADSGAIFAGQLIDLYANTLGEWSRPIILAAAFTTMFSTTLTVIDAFPRVLRRATELTLPNLVSTRDSKRLYLGFMVVVAGLSVLLLWGLGRSFTAMVDLATILSFLTAPVLAYINFRVVTSPEMPESAKPSRGLRVLSWLGLLFLIGFALFYLYSLLFM